MYELDSIRLQLASNGFILNWCEKTEGEDGYNHDYKSMIFKFSEVDKAVEKMMSMVKTIVPQQMMKNKMEGMKEMPMSEVED